MEQKFNVEGMMCAACVNHVEKATLKVEGVNSCQVSLLTNDMIVNYDGKETTKELIISSVSEAGYKASIDEDKPKLDESDEMRHRLYPSLVLMLLTMYVAMSHMLNLPLPSFMSMDKHPFVYALSQLLLTLPIVYLNKFYYSTGFKSLIQKSPNMNALIALGSSSALIYGIYALIMIGLGYVEFVHDLYFESAGMILTLITLGKYLEQKAKRKTTEAISSLVDLKAQMAIVKRDGKEVTILAKDVKVNDIVCLKPGMTVAVDGIITSGFTTIDESALTGESLPKEKNVNDEIMSGSINLSGSVEFKATKVGEDSTINTIIRLVSEAASSKAPIAKLADKIANVFVPIVIVISILTMIIWRITNAEFTFILSCGITVLVISCPCALGLATPVALMVSAGKAAQNGILVKSSEAIELLQTVNTVVLDKTGTVTENKAQVTDIQTFNFDSNSALKIAASLEKGSAHPLSKAILDKAINIKLEQVDNFNYLSGKGIVGQINGQIYFLGNEKLLNENLISFDDKIVDSYAINGKTPLLLADNERLIAIIAVEDKIKKESFDAINKLHDLNVKVVLLSGDKLETVKAVGDKLKVDEAIGEVLPDQKEDIIKDLQNKGLKVCMVGDGINDAIALTRANVGIAVKSGSDIAIESADVILMKDDLNDVANAITLSRRTLQIIKENLFWAFFYNSLMIPLAAGAYYPLFGIKLNPMIASACMSLSSITVVLNALRIRNVKLSVKMIEKKEIINMKKEVKIEGMMCMHCVKHASDALNKIDGVTAEVSLENNNAICTLTKEVSDEELTKAIAEAGYKVIDIKQI